jgi:hypothetical protein
MNATHNPAHIRRALAVLGMAALLVGVLTASLLYWSFGAHFAERAAYAFIGVIFAAAGGLLLPAAVALWQAERAAAAAGVFLFWLAAILPLGLSGHAGFFSLAQSELAAQSIPAQAERARLDAITARLDSSAGAGIAATALEAQAQPLRAQLNEARAQLAACPPDFVKKCINPAQARLDAIRAQLAPIDAQLSAHAGYLALQSERAETLERLATVSTGVAVGGHHPLFDTLAALLGVDAGRVQAIFLAWSAVALELVAALAFIISGALAGQAVGPAVVTRPHLEPVPALDTGGRIEADGLIHAHAGEAVLNAAAVAELERIAPGLVDKLNALQGGLGVPTAAVDTAGVTTTAAVDTAAVPTAGVTTADVKMRPCAQCGRPFPIEQRTPWNKRYCSDDCRARGHGFPNIDAARKAANRKRRGGAV